MLLKDSLHGCDIIHNPSARKLFYLQSFHASGKFLSILKILYPLQSIFEVNIPIKSIYIYIFQQENLLFYQRMILSNNLYQ